MKMLATLRHRFYFLSLSFSLTLVVSVLNRNFIVEFALKAEGERVLYLIYSGDRFRVRIGIKEQCKYL